MTIPARLERGHLSMLLSRVQDHVSPISSQWVRTLPIGVRLSARCPWHREVNVKGYTKTRKHLHTLCVHKQSQKYGYTYMNMYIHVSE